MGDIKFFVIFLVIFSWIFSGWPSFNLRTSDVLRLKSSHAQEASSTPETASSTPVAATSTPAEIATSTPAEIATSTSAVATSTPAETATSTPAAIPAEEKLATKSVLANLFGAFFDALSEFFGSPSKKDNAPKVATEDKIFAEKIFGDIGVSAIKRNAKAELWTSDLEKKNWQKIADEEMVSENSPIGFGDNIILWLSPDQRALVGFDTLSQVYFSQSIEPVGDTVIEFNSKKYTVLIQNNNIALVPQADDPNEDSF